MACGKFENLSWFIKILFDYFNYLDWAKIKNMKKVLKNSLFYFLVLTFVLGNSFVSISFDFATKIVHLKDGIIEKIELNQKMKGGNKK